jgi:hypothetical protein
MGYREGLMVTKTQKSMTDLDALLARAREADPGDRIDLRDEVAAHGDAAIEAMNDWLADPRLAAFAIRVLERVGQTPVHRPAVLEVLAAIDRDELPPHLESDLDRALGSLGIAVRSRPIAGGRGRRQSAARRPIGIAGVAGRGYWVMRTSPWERAYVWAEAEDGRLRQGWGWDETQNLEVIAKTVRAGGQLNDEQQLAWRARRMLSTEGDGMRLGDLVVAPNLPIWGRLSVFRVTDSYRWSPGPVQGPIERFGHVLPVALVAADIDRRSNVVSDGLRSMLRPQTRLYNISAFGGDVERVVGR